MILQPLGPRRRHDTWLWHLSLSACLEGGRVLWGGVRRKGELREQSGFLAHHMRLDIFVTFPRRPTYDHLSSHTCCAVLEKWLSDGHPLKAAEWRGSADGGPQGHQSWAACGEIQSFIKMTRLTLQIWSCPTDIRWFVLLLMPRCTWKLVSTTGMRWFDDTGTNCSYLSKNVDTLMYDVVQRYHIAYWITGFYCAWNTFQLHVTWAGSFIYEIWCTITIRSQSVNITCSLIQLRLDDFREK